MEIIKSYFKYYIDKNLYSKAIEELILCISKFKELHSEFESEKHLLDLANLKNSIENSNPINPMQFNAIYSDTLNVLLPIVEDLISNEGFTDFFVTSFIPTIEPDKFVAFDNLAISSTVFTSDFKLIAFAFDFESRKPEFDVELVEDNKGFYLEDMEVVALESMVQGLYSEDFFIDLAKNHPSGAIQIFDCIKRIDLITGESAKIFFTMNQSEWYW